MKRNLEITHFHYNGNKYNLCIDNNDPSGLGCIREIVTNNEYELDQYQGIKSSIFDIGANCGVATIIMAMQNPASTIYSFEPEPKTFNLLHANVLINGLDNVMLFPMAVSNNFTNSVQLSLHPDYSGGNSTCSDQQAFNQYFGKSTQNCSVACTSIDRVVNEFNISEIALLKIDCEGAEYEALYDSQFVQQGKVNSIIGEFHNLSYNSSTKGNCQELLKYCSNHIKNIGKITLLDL